MNKKILLSLAITAFASHAFGALKEGDSAPDFNLPASFAGKTTQFSLKEQLKKGSVVVYFYPSAYTKGCNIQAHTFSANSEKFSAAGASIVGVSLDSIERLNDFSADPEYCAGKLLVGSDKDGKVAKAFELEIRPPAEGKLDSRGITIDHGFAERTTFIISPNGKIAATISGLSPIENVNKSLEFVQNLSSAHQ